MIPISTWPYFSFMISLRPNLWRFTIMKIKVLILCFLSLQLFADEISLSQKGGQEHIEEQDCTPQMEGSCHLSSSWGMLGSIKGQKEIYLNFASLHQGLIKNAYDGKEVESFRRDVVGRPWVNIFSYTSDSHRGFFLSQNMPQDFDDFNIMNAFVYGENYMKDKCEKFNIRMVDIDSDYYHTYLHPDSVYSERYKFICETLRGNASDFVRKSSGLPVLVTWPSTNKKVLISRTQGHRSYTFFCSVSIQDLEDKRLCRFLNIDRP